VVQIEEVPLSHLLDEYDGEEIDEMNEERENAHDAAHLKNGTI
jgi:hypothetical protein